MKFAWKKALKPSANEEVFQEILKVFDAKLREESFVEKNEKILGKVNYKSVEVRHEKIEKKPEKFFLQFRREGSERNHQLELQMSRIFTSVIHSQKRPSGRFICELYAHEKPNFLSPVISWKAQTGQVNIIFQSNFWLKKGLICHH